MRTITDEDISNIRTACCNAKYKGYRCSFCGSDYQYDLRCVDDFFWNHRIWPTVSSPRIMILKNGMMKPCKLCGKMFRGYGFKKYCSPPCSLEAKETGMKSRYKIHRLIRKVVDKIKK